MANMAKTQAEELRLKNNGAFVIKKDALLALVLSACAFGFAMAWMQFSYEASNYQFAMQPSDSWVFKQAARIAIIGILLIFPSLSKFKSLDLLAIVACSVSAISCALLMAYAFAAQIASIPLGFLCGLLCGIAFVVPFAKWIAASLNTSFPSLFLVVSLGSVITGVLSWSMSLLPQSSAGGASAALPICSLVFLLLLEKKNVSPHILPDVERPHPNLVYFIIMAIAGGLVWSIIVQNWMPIIELSFLWFFIPCGIVASVIVIAVAKKRIASEIVFSLLVGFCGIVSLFALSPFFSSAVFYSAIFMSAWLLLLFSIAGSIWYGSAYHTHCLRVACNSIAIIYLVQFVIRFFTRLFEPYDVVLLVAAVVALVLSLMMLFIAQMQQVKSTNANGAISDETSTHADKTNDQRVAQIAQDFSLTDREVDVLQLLAKGNSVKSIAEKLVVSENTVKFHRSNIYQKLGISSRQSLIDMIDEI
ncbi:LuxR family transcriptional regulator [Eggerthellaceae bacterium 3-80]|nr:hypothetical protein D7W09_05570 [bacterium D16-34]